MEEERRVFKILTDERTGKKPLERPISRWENNFKMHHKEIDKKER